MFTVFGSRAIAIKMVASLIVGSIMAMWDYFMIEPEGNFSYSIYYWIGWAFIVIYLKYMFVDLIWKLWYRKKQKQVGKEN